MSLNESLLVSKNGDSGSGCAFTLDVKARGEWTLTGSYFNTPPYSFGQDAFQDIGVGADFSFTCDQPVYSLDTNNLPSFIRFEKEEDIPPQAFFPLESEGRRYHFRLDERAPRGEAFMLNFSFSANCQLRRKPRGTATTTETLIATANVSPQTGSCLNLTPISINPRRGALSYPVSVGGSCQQESPAPTLVPSEKPLRVDSSPLTSCSCDGLDLTSGSIERGQSATFTVYVKVDPNNPPGNDAEGRSVVFRLEKQTGDSWSEITNSPVLPLLGPTQTPVGVRRYASSWTTTMPATGSGLTTYRVRVAESELQCSERSSESLQTRKLSQTSPSLIERLLSFFFKIPPTPDQQTQTQLLREPRTIQFGSLTIDPNAPTPRLVRNCSSLEFAILY